MKKIRAKSNHFHFLCLGSPGMIPTAPDYDQPQINPWRRWSRRFYPGGAQDGGHMTTPNAARVPQQKLSQFISSAEAGFKTFRGPFLQRRMPETN